MSIFGRGSMDMYSLQSIGDQITNYVEKQVPVFTEVLIGNIKDFLKKNPKYTIEQINDEQSTIWLDSVQKLLDDYAKTIPGYGINQDDKVRIILCAYIVWAIGAYINGQNLLKKQDQLRLSDIITSKVCTASEREYYNMNFKSILYYEHNKIYQASKLVESIINAKELISDRVSCIVKSRAAENFVPIVELIAGRIGVEVERILKIDRWEKSLNEVKTYYFEIRSSFSKLDLIIEEAR